LVALRSNRILARWLFNSESS